MTTATANAPAGTEGRVVTVNTSDGDLWTGVRKNATHGVVMTIRPESENAGHRVFAFSATEEGAAKQANKFAALGWIVETFTIV